jgi:hypothetical protein
MRSRKYKRITRLAFSVFAVTVAVGASAPVTHAELIGPWMHAGTFPTTVDPPHQINDCRVDHISAVTDAGTVFVIDGFGCWAAQDKMMEGFEGGWNLISPGLREGARWSSAVARYGPHIYKVGGNINSGLADLVYRITPKGSGQYEQRVAGRLPSSLESSAAVVHNGFLYVIGGKDATGATRREVYSAAVTGGGSIGTFKLAGLLPAGRSEHQAVVVRDRVYVLGGWERLPNLSLVRSEKVWHAPLTKTGTLGGLQETAPLPQPVSHHAAVSVGNDIYSVGGSGGGTGDETWIARPDAVSGAIPAWQTSVHRLPEPRNSHALVNRRGVLVLTGGYGGGVARNNSFSVPTDSLPSNAELLDQYRPELRYAVTETYRADSAATITDNCVWDTSANRLVETNYLRDSRGKEVAAGCAQLRSADLSLGYLGSYTPRSGDYLDEDDDHALTAQRLHGIDRYRDLIYGRAVDLGSEGRILQYWFWYYNNPFGPLGVGNHEGDWEMVQFHIGSDLFPVAATYAQHNGGERCEWRYVERTPSGRPVVYVGSGTHASWFAPGPEGTSTEGERVVPAVEDVTSPPTWQGWAGRWGGSTGTTDSPQGPGHGGNLTKWHDPQGWSESAGIDPCDVPEVSASSRRRAREIRLEGRRVPLPRVTARASARTVTFRYRFASVPRDARLRPKYVLTAVDTRGDRYPPLTSWNRVRGTAAVVRQPIGRGTRPFRTYVQVVSRDGTFGKLLRVKAGR